MPASAPTDAPSAVHSRTVGWGLSPGPTSPELDAGSRSSSDQASVVTRLVRSLSMGLLNRPGRHSHRMCHRSASAAFSSDVPPLSSFAGPRTGNQREPPLGPGVAPVKACDHDHTMLLRLEEEPVRKSPHTSSPPPAVHQWELLGVRRNGIHRRCDGSRETIAQAQTHCLVPCLSLPEIRNRSRHPDDRANHRRLDNSDLTCSHGITSEGCC
jgi:hypothetical protein